MSEKVYYLTDFMDEVLPCDCTLEGWAEWLSKPDESWDRAEAAKDGEVFHAYVYEIHQVSAVNSDGVWSLEPEPPAKTEFMAVRHGDKMGWFAEDVVDDLIGLQAYLESEITIHPDCAYFVACSVPQPIVALIYNSGQLSIADDKGRA